MHRPVPSCARAAPIARPSASARRQPRQRAGLAALLLTLAATTLPALAVTPAQAIAELHRTLDEPMRREGQPAPGLRAQMQRARLPGLSIAVVHQGRLHWAEAFGEASAGVPMSAGTRLQAASISKPITALAALALADETGTGWDDDLRPQLGGLVPPGDDGAPRYTLRRLLTHSAGLGVDGFPGYAVGTPVPSLRQVLEGTPPANTEAVRPEHAPGSFRYSGGGTSLVQWWMQQRAAQPDFARLMQQRILRPLGMTESHFEQPPRDGAPASAYAHGHVDGQPLPGGHRVHPEQAAAGLWTTPRDLARLILAVQAARRGEPGTLAPALARAATTPGPVHHMGIGFFLSGEPRQLLHFGHDGLNEGFLSTLRGSLDGGEGVVVMANADGAADTVVEGVVRTLARLYGWPARLQAPLLAASQALPPAAMDWVGDYPGFTSDETGPIRIRLAQDALWAIRGPGDWVRLWRLADDSGYTTNGQHRYRFDAERLTLDGRTLKREPARERSTWPALYLRGTFNDWRTTLPLRPAGPGRWETELTLPAGRHAFKLADADWREVDLGGGDDAAVPPDTWHRLVGRGGNLLLELAAAGRWRVELELSDSPRPARVRWQALSSGAGS